MLITQGNLDGIYRGFNTSFQKGFKAAPTHYEQIAMVVPSGTRETTYAWLGQMPRLREWLGDRQINSLTQTGYTIKNRKFESTIEVAREDIEDDTYGVMGPLFTELGRSAAAHPDELIFDLLSTGFTEKCYDNQNFFDEDHPVITKAGKTLSVSNMQAGEGEPWFLFDTSRAIKPIIFQKRVDYELQRLDKPDDPNVFMRDNYLYGIRARANAGFGLWQLAYGSKAALTPDNYRDARAAMTALRGDQGRPLGIAPDTLVVGPVHEEAGRTILNATLDAEGGTNVWKDTAKLVVTPWLSPELEPEE